MMFEDNASENYQLGSDREERRKRDGREGCDFRGTRRLEEVKGPKLRCYSTVARNRETS